MEREKEKNGLGIASLVLGIIGICLAFIPIVRMLCYILGILSIIFGLISCFKKSNKAICIIGLILGIIAIIVTVYFQHSATNKLTDLLFNGSDTIQNILTDNNANTVSTTNTSSKNYQTIYDEYSQKLIEAGPTSSINEMAEIVNEGISEMAKYMYSASGTDGQYSTYSEWAEKLLDVYLENCK